MSIYNQPISFLSGPLYYTLISLHHKLYSIALFSGTPSAHIVNKRKKTISFGAQEVDDLVDLVLLLPALGVHLAAPLQQL